MLRSLTRWAAVPVATLALGTLSVAGAPAAEALGMCAIPAPLAGVGAGAFTSPADFDAWLYPVPGTTTVQLIGIGASMRVFAANNCTTRAPVVCSSATACTVTVNGPITIRVSSSAFGGAYVLTATSTALNAAPCSHVSAGGVCVGLAIGPVLQGETIYGVTTTPLTTHTVGGWLDAYRFPLPTGGSTVVPCVVLTVNTRDANPCATAGGTFVSRTLTLVSESATQPQVVTGSELATVRVCDATLNATVNGFGIENVPIYSTC